MSKTTIAVEAPGLATSDNLHGSPLSHLESGIRRGLGLSANQSLDDEIDEIKTGLKQDASELLDDVVEGRDIDLDVFIPPLNMVRDNRTDFISREEFEAGVDDDDGPVLAEQYDYDELDALDFNELTETEKDELDSYIYRAAVKWRNRKIFRDQDVDMFIVISDGNTSARTVADDAMFYNVPIFSYPIGDLVQESADTGSHTQSPA